MTVIDANKLKSLNQLVNAEIDNIFNSEKDDIEFDCLESTVLENMKARKTFSIKREFDRIISNKTRFKIFEDLGNVWVRKLNSYPVEEINDGVDTWGKPVIRDKFNTVISREDVISAMSNHLTDEGVDYGEFMSAVLDDLSVSNTEMIDHVEQTLMDVIHKDKGKNYLWHDGYPDGNCWVQSVAKKAAKSKKK